MGEAGREGGRQVCLTLLRLSRGLLLPVSRRPIDGHGAPPLLALPSSSSSQQTSGSPALQMPGRRKRYGRNSRRRGRQDSRRRRSRNTVGSKRGSRWLQTRRRGRVQRATSNRSIRRRKPDASRGPTPVRWTSRISASPFCALLEYGPWRRRGKDGGGGGGRRRWWSWRRDNYMQQP